MQYFLGCFGILLIIAILIAFVSWMTSNIVGVIGLVLLISGVFALLKNRKTGAKLKVPSAMIVIGAIASVIWFASGDNNQELVEENSQEQISENVTETDQDKEKEKLEAEEQAKKEEAQRKAAEQKAQEEAKEKAEAERKAQEEEEKQEQQAKNNSAQALGLEAVLVSRVVDGDTIELADGRKIRLVGVNTPESTTRHETYGKEASNYTTSKLEGKKVFIQKDVSDKDRYNRYLRLVWISIPTNLMNESEIRTKMFNADLVLNGYAEPSTYPPDVTYSDYFIKLAREARANGTGLWAYGENGTTKGDLDSSRSQTPLPPENTSPSGQSDGEESYKNCTELRKVYPNGVGSNHPAYDPKHDRDKDNWACEAS